MENKNYVAPKMEIIGLEVENVLCASAGASAGADQMGEEQ